MSVLVVYIVQCNVSALNYPPNLNQQCTAADGIHVMPHAASRGANTGIVPFRCWNARQVYMAVKYYQDEISASCDIIQISDYEKSE